MREDPRELSNERLINWLVNDQTNNVPIGELTRRNIEAINKLNISINDLNRTTTKYNCWLIGLTVVIAVLTLVYTVATILMLIRLPG